MTMAVRVRSVNNDYGGVLKIGTLKIVGLGYYKWLIFRMISGHLYFEKHPYDSAYDGQLRIFVRWETTNTWVVSKLCIEMSLPGLYIMMTLWGFFSVPSLHAGEIPGESGHVNYLK